MNKKKNRNKKKYQPVIDIYLLSDSEYDSDSEIYRQLGRENQKLRREIDSLHSKLGLQHGWQEQNTVLKEVILDSERERDEWKAKFKQLQMKTDPKLLPISIRTPTLMIFFDRKRRNPTDCNTSIDTLHFRTPDDQDVKFCTIVMDMDMKNKKNFLVSDINKKNLLL